MRRVRLTAKPLLGLDRFGTLLFFLLAAFLASGSSGSGWLRVVGALANVGALLAGFLATGIWADRRRLVVLASVGVGSTVLVGFAQTSIAAAIGALGQAIVLEGILIAVVRRVLGHERVELATIAGAIAAYVLIGLIFAWIYLAAYGVFDGPILDPEEPGVPTYYSFVVLSTLGFGDVTPVDEFVKRLTAFEAITGQIFLATLVARLVSLYGRPTGQD